MFPLLFGAASNHLKPFSFSPPLSPSNSKQQFSLYHRTEVRSNSAGDTLFHPQIVRWPASVELQSSGNPYISLLKLRNTCALKLRFLQWINWMFLWGGFGDLCTSVVFWWFSSLVLNPLWALDPWRIVNHPRGTPPSSKSKPSVTHRAFLEGLPVKVHANPCKLMN